jgi:hypothetical protein
MQTVDVQPRAADFDGAIENRRILDLLGALLQLPPTRVV